MDFQARKAWAGRAFVSVWAVGAVIFFFIPLGQSLYFTFHELTFTPTGMQLTPLGFDNYIYAFVQDPYFLGYLGESVANMLISMPLIILFALFAAVILNIPFKGRAFVRGIFFFPVIVTSGALIYVLKTDTSSVQSAASSTFMLRNLNVGYILLKIIRNQRIVNFIVAMMDQVFVVIWKSGVQMLLFLAGLQAISPSLYECANIEGASAWEKFWKITFPMVSPIMLINVIYTIVDSFNDYNNSMLRYVITCTFGKVQYTFGTTLAWLYFLITAAILGAATKLVTRFVFYEN